MAVANIKLLALPTPKLIRIICCVSFCDCFESCLFSPCPLPHIKTDSRKVSKSKVYLRFYSLISFLIQKLLGCSASQSNFLKHLCISLQRKQVIHTDHCNRMMHRLILDLLLALHSFISLEPCPTKSHASYISCQTWGFTKRKI